MLIRTRSDVRPTRRAYLLGAALIALTLGMWALQQTVLAPLPHDRDSTLLGMAFAVASALGIFWVMDQRDADEG